MRRIRILGLGLLGLSALASPGVGMPLPGPFLASGGAMTIEPEKLYTVASQAGFRVADIYRISGDKAREVGQLRTVLRRYPKTKESAAAHDRLESYGVALVGGEAEAEK